ncbi:MAG: 2-hydroxyacyl-CoA dehydratase, partial [Dictyoglomus sp.]
MIDSFYLYLKDKINIGGYVGYMCSYVPPEILYSAGFEPLPLVFSPCYPEKTDEIYPKYFCPYIKNINEFLMRNEITLEKVVITDGCDSSKRIYECWKDLKLASEIYFLKIPFNKGESSIGYFAEELKDLYIKLLGYEDKGRLIDTINFYNSLRRTLINQGG